MRGSARDRRDDRALPARTLIDATGEVEALNRKTGAIVYRHQLPTSANSPIAIAANTGIVPAGGPITGRTGGGGNPQVVAYSVR